MTSEKPGRTLKAVPFRPSRIHLGGGRSLEIAHPELALISPGGRIVAIYDEPDALEIVDVFMIQSIQFLPDRRGGQTRRKAS